MSRHAIDVLEDLRTQLEMGAEGQETLAPSIARRLLLESMTVLEAGAEPELTNEQLEVVTAGVKRRISDLYRDPLSSLLKDLHSSWLEEPFPDNQWALLEGLFVDRLLIGKADYWLLVAFVRDDWEHFSPTQRQRLKPMLEAALSVCPKSSAGRVLIPEMLSSLYGAKNG